MDNFIITKFCGIGNFFVKKFLNDRLQVLWFKQSAVISLCFNHTFGDKLGKRRYIFEKSK